MADLFVSPREDTAWRIDAADLAARLRARWPEAEARVMTLEGIEGELDFSVPLGAAAPLRGTLEPEGQAVGLDGDLPQCAAFAAWFREQVPAGQELVLWDTGGSLMVVLEPGVEAAEIERRVAEQWRS
jgi:hypothetical protein